MLVLNIINDSTRLKISGEGINAYVLENFSLESVGWVTVKIVGVGG